ncbi:iron-containing alcohol dehydrogenase [Streptomyces sp. NPDC002088]|uniref:iron-containing alcohol dehydrogenase n=1 Tax=Streptomyces sp. NPDC002088 TaxID=3154665 RepID=UPI00331B41E3
MPHAPTHTVVLRHALAHNQQVPEAAAALGRAMGDSAGPATSRWELVGRLGAPRSLRELAMAEGDINRVVELALAHPYANPREVTAEGLTRLLRAAWAGEPPAA